MVFSFLIAPFLITILLLPRKFTTTPGSFRINPNLYNCGTVCLSLSGTWQGRDNEPGYPESYGATRDGHRRSKEYSDNAFLLSLKTMMYTMRKPPKHFEDLVADLLAISGPEPYSEGAPVGSVIYNLGPTISNSAAKNQKEFQLAVHRMMNTLIAFFTKNRSTDWEEFRSPEILNMSAAASATLTECYNSVSGVAALTL
ncbi:putative ubiquitin-conjugating enzyme E2 38 [Arachis duranensis]|uniref:Ubiquitin-conjugating enzyme E2 38 n=1 Tax=Arachis duranensis TaxID=130453 RepID=A0A9C6TFC8_ARADU|nr:putative ubiquitin-conjugating enzyme E2 38 [Arachis duranensis]XP_052115542.1 putative ubiquitin-conjugating enzyme E2 38 [Arachis duranensis]XP_052115543.1 putative ubiquitin-conjugating enzyme E2 38 [Arachis duranensis]XP_052115544.1 putative ubiquitin-conjugating enzyme E2 38 [Arachis duranensis]XP_052115545.1 putative ubiquitin-conjugating enzyme E2 38 [Arachis duranensis]